MAGRIVLFGATGFTGRLTAHALLRRGARPVLAGRNAARLEELVTELGAGALETAIADVAQPRSVRALVGKGDVLVSTVGPFTQVGEAAVEAALATGALYLDSTGEPPFIRRVFEEWGPRARIAGTALVTAFGYDFVPGNLGAVVACRAAAGRARRVDVGYFLTGSAGAAHLSAGTRASLAAVATQPGFRFSSGRLEAQRGAASVRAFTVDGRSREGVSIGGSEHFAVPAAVPEIRDVNVYLGWFGPLSRVVQAASAATGLIQRTPAAARVLEGVMGRVPAPAPRSGPDAATRAQSGSNVVALAYDEHDRAVGAARLLGINGYDYTARMLAWGAIRAAAGGIEGRGALGPVAAFTAEALRAGSAEAGLPVTEELATT